MGLFLTKISRVMRPLEIFVRNKVRREEVVILCAGRQMGPGGCRPLEDVSGSLHTSKTRECHARRHRCNIRAFTDLQTELPGFSISCFQGGCCS